MIRVPKDWSSDQAKWVNLKWSEIRKAQSLADEANNRWKRVNSELNEYLTGMQEFDVVQRAKVKNENMALKDALSVGDWHSRNAERHMQDLSLFLKMKEMGLL